MQINKLSKKSFTITEVIIVVVLVSVIASFAVVQLRKVVEKSRQRNIRQNVTLMGAAEEVYKAKYGVYWSNTSDVSPTTIDEINANLNLSVVPGGSEMYRCSFSIASGTPESMCWASLNSKINGKWMAISFTPAYSPPSSCFSWEVGTCLIPKGNAVDPAVFQ